MTAMSVGQPRPLPTPMTVPGQYSARLDVTLPQFDFSTPSSTIQRFTREASERVIKQITPELQDLRQQGLLNTYTFMPDHAAAYFGVPVAREQAAVQALAGVKGIRDLTPVPVRTTA